MRDEDMLLNLFEIAQWLDKVGQEIHSLGLIVTDLIAAVPVSVEAWDKVGNQIWDK
jgi:hypothetical protein